MSKQLLKRVKARGAPLVEGDTATFVWRGKEPPIITGDFTDWEMPAAVEFDRVGPNLWIATMRFPPDAYIEYVYEYKGQRALDSLNPRTISNGIGDLNNYFWMPEAQPTDLARRQRSVPAGRVTHHRLETHQMLADEKRRVFLYEPPVAEPCPLVVVWDGPDYLRRANLAALVDNLIARGRMRPVALALVGNARRARGVEYACSDMPLIFLKETLIPFARQQLNLIDPLARPGAYGVMGASMGGVMALYTGLRLPEIFGQVLSQSGAFVIEKHELVVFDLVRLLDRRELNIWMGVGRFESLLEPNRQMVQALEARGYEPAYHEYNAGHNYTAWREYVWRGLEDLFSAET